MRQSISTKAMRSMKNMSADVNLSIRIITYSGLNYDEKLGHHPSDSVPLQTHSSHVALHKRYFGYADYAAGSRSAGREALAC